MSCEDKPCCVGGPLGFLFEGLNAPNFARIHTFVNTLVGRDKIGKTTQYACRFLFHNLLTADPNHDIGKRIKSLYSTISTSRKWFRFGKSINQYKSMMKFLSSKDFVVKVLGSVSKLSGIGYFFFDALAFLISSKVYKGDKAWVKLMAHRAWFGMNTLGILLELYKLQTNMTKIIKAAAALKAQKEGDDDEASFEARAEWCQLMKARSQSYRTLVRLSMDVLVASQTLGLPGRLGVRGGKGFHNGDMGVFGVISGLIGLTDQWRKVC